MLGRRKRMHPPERAATPITQFVLEWPPVPEHMPDHAERIVSTVLQIEGVRLDYSVESLQTVDRLLAGFHRDGDDPGLMAETVFRFGAYVGEVMIRTHGGCWVLLPNDHPLGSAWPMHERPGGKFSNPIGRVYKRIANGEEDSIVYFHHALYLAEQDEPT